MDEIRDSGKILFVVRTLSEGGSERVSSILASTFERVFGYSVYVCVLNNNEKEYELSDKVEKITLYKTNNIKIFKMWYELTFIRKSIKRIKPNVIISLDSYRTNLLIEISNIGIGSKIILSERNDPNKIPPKKIGRILTPILYKLCDGIVFQTIDAKNFFSKDIQKKSTIIPNPIALNHVEVYKGKWNSRRKAIVNCSRLVPQKNIPLLIDAFSEILKIHPDYKLEIYGEGFLQKELEQQVRRLGIEKEVSFMGFRKDILESIKDAAIYVSTSDYEGISNSMLEAMALGIPTICTDCPIGGARMMIRDNENGILVPVGNKNSIIEAINKIINDSDFADRIGNNAKEIVNEMSVNQITERWVDFIKRNKN